MTPKEISNELARIAKKHAEGFTAPEQTMAGLVEIVLALEALTGVPALQLQGMKREALMTALSELGGSGDQPEDDPAGQAWPKICPCCKRVHSEAGWNGLSLVGFCGAFKARGVRYAVELRNCVCASTIGVERQLPMATHTTAPTFMEQRAAQVSGIHQPATVVKFDKREACCLLQPGHAGECEPF